MKARDRVAIRLLASGWMAACHDPIGAGVLLEEIAELTGELKREDPELCLAVDAARARFGFISGRRAEATALGRRVLDERVSVLGPDHPDTLTSRSNLAYFMGEGGDRGAARDLLAPLVADSQRVLGDDHPNTLAIRHEHAYYVGEAGDRAAARDLFAAVAADGHRFLGSGHQITLASRYQHAECVGQAGDRAAAGELFAAVATDVQRFFRCDHPCALASRYRQAFYASQSGDLTSEAAMAADALDLVAHVFGLREPAGRATRAIVLALATTREVARTVVGGGGPRLHAAAASALRADPTVAMDLLTGWCEATRRAEPRVLSRAVGRVIDIAVSAGRAAELGAAVMRAMPRTDDSRGRVWIAEWSSACIGRDELAATHRMLCAASAGRAGDATALLRLAAEEQRVVRQIMEAPAESDLWGS